MEEIEVPTEQLTEEIHHAAHESHSRWISWVALTSALLAVFAAVTALLAGHHANEAMIEQLRASDQWGYYQSKGIKHAVLASKVELLESMDRKASDKDERKLEQYKKEQDEISEKAKELEASASAHLGHHMIFARGVTMFQVAIGIAAIAVLTRRRRYFLVALGFGGAGLVFLAQGLL
jgi:hypothetical protein